MIVTLFNKSITISDVNQFERLEVENYKFVPHGVSAGIYKACAVCNDEEILVLRTNNLCVIDKRSK